MDENKLIKTHLPKDVIASVSLGVHPGYSGSNTSGIPLMRIKSPCIFLECAGKNGYCGNTIAIICDDHTESPYILKRISDQQAGNLFRAIGWSIIGDDNSDGTRCPECRQQ